MYSHDLLIMLSFGLYALYAKNGNKISDPKIWSTGTRSSKFIFKSSTTRLGYQMQYMASTLTASARCSAKSRLGIIATVRQVR